MVMNFLFKEYLPEEIFSRIERLVGKRQPCEDYRPSQGYSLDKKSLAFRDARLTETLVIIRS